MKERNKAVPAVYLILIRGGKMLLTRRFNTGYQDGNYDIPSGHVEAGEFPLAAAIREAREEIGIKVKKEDLVLVHTLYRPQMDPTGERIDLFFWAKRWTGEPHIVEPHKCDDIGWFKPKKRPKNMVPHIQIALEAMQKGKLYTELAV